MYPRNFANGRREYRRPSFVCSGPKSYAPASALQRPVWVRAGTSPDRSHSPSQSDIVDLANAVPFFQLVLRCEPFAKRKARDQVGSGLILCEDVTIRQLLHEIKWQRT